MRYKVCRCTSFKVRVQRSSPLSSAHSSSSAVFSLCSFSIWASLPAAYACAWKALPQAAISRHMTDMLLPQFLAKPLVHHGNMGHQLSA